MADGQIEIDITANIEQFKQAVQGLVDQVKRESKGMATNLSTIGNGLSNFGNIMTMGVTVPLAAAAGAAAKFSFDTIAAAEQASIAFETMLGPQKARSMLEDLADFAANTPFELQGLESSTQKLIAMGFEAEECIPLLTSIGDAASGLGAGQAGIDQITRALGQMNAKGKVSAEEMMQLTETGIPAWQYLADVISNGDIPTAMQMVTNGVVDADTAIQALQDGMNRDFGGMMSKQAQTLTGVLSNMADAVQKPLMAIKDTDGYKDLTAALSDLTDSLGPFVESLMPHLESVLKSGAGAVKVFAGALDSFSNMSEESQAGVLQFVLALAGVGPAAKVAGAGFNVAGSAVGFLAKEITDADGKTTTWGATLKNTASDLGALRIAGVALGGVLVALLAGFAVDQIISYATEVRNLESATTGLITAQESAQEAVYGTNDAAESGINSWQSYSDAIDSSIAKSAEMAQSFQDTWAEYYTNEQLLNRYVDTIQELAGQTGLTASQQGDLQRAVEQYNSITGDSVEVTDAASGALSKSADEIRKNADAWLENAKAQAYADSIAEATKTLVEQEQAYQTSKQALEELRAQYEATGSSNEYLAQQIANGEADLRKQQETMNATKGTIESYSNSMDGVAQSVTAFIGTSQTWLDAMGESGIALESMGGYLDALGIKQETLASMTPDQVNTIVSAYDALSQKGIDVNKFASDMAAIGLSQEQLAAATPDQMSALADAWTGFTNAGYNVSDFKSQLESVGISQQDLANLTPTQISQIVSAYSNGQASIDQIAEAIKNGTIDKLGQAGSGGSQAYASGLSSGQGSISGASQGNANAATGPLEEAGSQGGDWGSHLGQNFANGLSGAVDWVANAANSIASTVSNILGHSVPKEGILREGGRGEAVWGEHLVENLAGGMLRKISLIEDASSKIANSIAKKVQNTSLPMINIDGQLSSLAIPDNMSAQLAQVSAASIIQAPIDNTNFTADLSDGFNSIVSKLDEVTSRIDKMDKNISAKLASPVQIKYNRRELGRMQREVV